MKNSYKLHQLNDYPKLSQELAARANYAELELAKLQLERESFDNIKKKLKEEIYTLKLQHESDEIKIKELNYTISQLTKNIQEIQSTSNDVTREQQKTLEKLKSSLADVEAVVSYRATTSKRYLSKISRSLATYSQGQVEGSIQSKNSLKKFTKEVSGCLEELGKIMNNTISVSKAGANEDSFKETMKEKDQTIEEYRKTLEKMREQMHFLRDRVREMEAQSSRRSLPEYDHKIKVLTQEKESMVKHINSLEESLREQSEFMVSLKEAIIPEKDEVTDIDEEIALVDQEILELQCSLERALS